MRPKNKLCPKPLATHAAKESCIICRPCKALNISEESIHVASSENYRSFPYNTINKECKYIKLHRLTECGVYSTHNYHDDILQYQSIGHL